MHWSPSRVTTYAFCRRSKPSMTSCSSGFSVSGFVAPGDRAHGGADRHVGAMQVPVAILSVDVVVGCDDRLRDPGRP